jgi:hypothetical protein
MTPTIAGLHPRSRPPEIRGREAFPLTERMAAMADRIKKARAEPLVGITTDGTLVPAALR